MNQGGEPTGRTKKANKSVTMDKGLSTWGCGSDTSQEARTTGKAKVKNSDAWKARSKSGVKINSDTLEIWPQSLV